LLNKYATKFQEAQLTQIRLADLVTIRKMLAEKLYREIQGFRSSVSDYSELEKVNPNDIKKVIHDIKAKLGH
jgi:hypothetical protein